MKKIIKIIGIILLLLIISLIALPIIFKGKIERQVVAIANENLNAKVDFSGVDLSLISDFPHVSVDVNDFVISGVDEFQGINLAEIKKIASTIEFWSLFGDKIAVTKILIDSPVVDVRVLADGKANYDIAKEEGTAVDEPTDDEANGIKINLKNYEIKNGTIHYSDASMPMTMDIHNLNHTGSGDLTADQTVLKTTTQIETLDITYDDIQYIKKAKANWDADLDLDLKNSKYTFDKNELKINELLLNFEGWVAMQNDDIIIDITYASPQSDFKQLVSMIPSEFAMDLEGVDVAGELALAGYAKGKYNEKSMPGFGVDLKVKDGKFHYPDMPKSVENIQVKAKVNASGGNNFNDLLVDVPKFYMEMADNPIDIRLNVKDGMTDPLIDLAIRAKVILDNLKEVIPLQKGDALEGLMLANMSMKGRLSDLENEKYDRFQADGDMQVQDILYKTDSLPYDVNILVANLDFSPAYLDLTQFKATIGKSDIQAVGKATNYLAYVLKNEKINGDFTVTSKLLDLNEMMVEEEESTTESESTNSGDLSAIDIPGNVNFKLYANFKKMKYGDMVMDNVNGNLVIDEHVAKMHGLEMDFLDGHMTMDGEYNSSNLEKPLFDLDFDMKDMNIKEMAEMFYTIDRLAPLAKSCQGKFSTNLQLKSTLDQNMEPLMTTMTGNGRMNVKEVFIEKFKPLNEIAKTLGIDKLANQSFKDVNLSYTIQDGKAIVKPFTVKIDGIDTEIEGSTGLLDQAIDYTMKMDIPYNRLPKQATGAMNNLIAQINGKLGSNISMSQKIPIHIRVTGTVTNPKIATNYGDIVKDEIADIKEQVKEEINQKVDEAKEEARKRARAEADKILADAKKKSDKLLQDAQKLADQGKNEAYKQAAQVEKSYKNVFEKAAKKIAADKIRQQADKAHKSAMDKARQKSASILSKAKKQADAKIAAIK